MNADSASLFLKAEGQFDYLPGKPTLLFSSCARWQGCTNHQALCVIRFGCTSMELMKGKPFISP